MNYQEIPFLIWAEDRKIGESIRNILGRKYNTVVECGSLETVSEYLQESQGFQCIVFHLSDNRNHFDEVLESTVKNCPASAVLVFSFKSLSLVDYQSLIRNGAADVLIYDESVDQVTFLEGLLRILNQRWYLYRWSERGKRKIFEATVVTAYHEINQALTVIINAIGLFKLDIEQEYIDVPKLEKISDFILRGTNRVQEILNKLKQIKDPVLKEYTPGVSMVCLDLSSEILPGDKTPDQIFKEKPDRD
jgi:hypothetical protein